MIPTNSLPRDVDPFWSNSTFFVVRTELNQMNVNSLTILLMILTERQRGKSDRQTLATYGVYDRNSSITELIWAIHTNHITIWVSTKRAAAHPLNQLVAVSSNQMLLRIPRSR